MAGGKIKKKTKKTASKTRCSNTKTDTQFFQWILSQIRRMTLRWKPRGDKLNEGRIKMPKGKNGREVWCNNCEQCGKWFKLSDLHADHIIPIGGLTKFEHLERWFKNAFVEIDGFQRLCHECHKTKTNNERNVKK